MSGRGIEWAASLRKVNWQSGLRYLSYKISSLRATEINIAAYDLNLPVHSCCVKYFHKHPVLSTYVGSGNV